MPVGTKLHVSYVEKIPDTGQPVGGRELRAMKALGVIGYSHDVSHPVNFGALNRVFLEEIVLHEFDATGCQCGGAFLGPYRVFSLLNDWATILKDESELRIQLAELDIKPS